MAELSRAEDGQSVSLPALRGASQDLGDDYPRMPPLRLEKHRIATSRTPSLNSTRTDFFKTTCPQFTRAAFSARQRRYLNDGGGLAWRDGSLTDRPSKTRHCPGALGWLYGEPDSDHRRQERWIKSCPGPECAIRQELRTPVTTPRGTPREHFSHRGQKLDSCLKQVCRYQPSDSAVLQAAQRRQDRLRALSDLEEAKPLEVQQHAEQMRPEVSQMAESEAHLEPPETDPEPGPLASLFHGRSRGSCGMSKEPLAASASFPKLAALSQATPFDLDVLVKDISAFIVEHAHSEEERAWMSFCWVCFHISLDCDDFTCKLPERVLPLRVGGAWSISKIFGAICSAVHVPAKVVPGHVRHASSFPGDDICADSRNRHWWNAVYLGNQWVLVDCASGAASQEGEQLPQSRSFQPYFFGPAPEDLAFSHYPTESRWQLLPEPLSYDTFVGQVHTAVDVFAASGFVFSPQRRPGGTITLGETNTGCVQLRAPSNLQVRASLSGEAAHCFVAAEGSRRVKLKITVVGATNLRNADVGGRLGKYDVSDPYCVCQVKSKEHVSFRTEVAMDKLNPIWNHTSTIDDLEPGDELCFRIFDKDIVTQDDFLGEVSLSTCRFLIGGAFEGDVELNGCGGMGAKLRLRIQPLYVQDVQPALPEVLGTTAIYFRAPKGCAEHHLELYAGEASTDTFQRICMFKVLASADPPDFTEPLFPKVFPGACRLYGLTFSEALPHGRHILGSKNEVELHLNKTTLAPQGLEVVGDVDGDRSAVLAHVSGDTVVIRAQVPKGHHSLSIFARRSKQKQFACAVVYRLHVPEDCEEVITGGFPLLQDAYRELGAILEAPLKGTLQVGLHRICIRLPQELADAKITLTTGIGTSRETTNIPYRNDGTFEADVHISAPEATLLCETSDGSARPLLRWTVPSGRKSLSNAPSRQVSSQQGP